MQNDQIIEQDWWEEIHLQPSEINGRPDDLDELGSLRISCVPAQHGSARTGFDKGASLWAGFVIEQFACKPSDAPERTCIYFAGYAYHASILMTGLSEHAGTRAIERNLEESAALRLSILASDMDR